MSNAVVRIGKCSKCGNEQIIGDESSSRFCVNCQITFDKCLSTTPTPWEYAFLQIEIKANVSILGDGTTDTGIISTESTESLAELGLRGWQVYAIVPCTSTEGGVETRYVAAMKREISGLENLI